MGEEREVGGEEGEEREGGWEEREVREGRRRWVGGDGGEWEE